MYNFVLNLLLLSLTMSYSFLVFFSFHHSCFYSTFFLKFSPFRSIWQTRNDLIGSGSEITKNSNLYSAKWYGSVGSVSATLLLIAQFLHFVFWENRKILITAIQYSILHGNLRALCCSVSEFMVLLEIIKVVLVLVRVHFREKNKLALISSKKWIYNSPRMLAFSLI